MSSKKLKNRVKIAELKNRAKDYDVIFQACK